MAITKASKTAAAPAAPALPSWMKKGADAAKHIEQIDKEIEERREKSKRKYFRYWLSEGEEGRVTFVDGNLTEKGVLDITTFMEHSLFMNGKWGNEYVCTAEVEPCPLCEEGNKPALVGALTVIDHRKIEGKNGKIYQDEPKLYIAKRDVIKILQSLAGKRGGLAGCVFDIMRTGEKSFKVGNQFDFIEKLSVEECREKYVREVEMPGGKKKVETYFVPADYQNDIEFVSAAELREKGFGNKKIIGNEKALTSKDDLAKEL